MEPKYPIESIREEVMKALENQDILLINASPGSGKTSQIPTWWFNQNKVVWCLCPRKIAAKSMATYISKEKNISLGTEVGYQFRFEAKRSENCKISFFTEGTFLKIFKNDPELLHVDIVILDEFHERHLDIDLALALLLPLVEKRKGRLKLIIMSATLDKEEIKKFLPQAKLLELKSPPYPLEIRFIGHLDERLRNNWQQQLLDLLPPALEFDRDVLVFLPGKKEINQAIQLCQRYPDLEVLPLYGDLGLEEQLKVYESSSQQRVIFSTNIAESALTIPNISTVIDFGLSRKLIKKGAASLPQLILSKISKAEATQRSGRANRTGPGLCLRAYSEIDFLSREPSRRPEILDTPLEEILLTEKSFPHELHWPTPPPKETYERAQKNLCFLNALDDQKHLTPIGTFLSQAFFDFRTNALLLGGKALPTQKHATFLQELVTFLSPPFQKRQMILEKLKHNLKEAPRLPREQIDDLNYPWFLAFIDQIAQCTYRQGHPIFLSVFGEEYTLAPEVDGKEIFNKDLVVLTHIDPNKKVLDFRPIERDWIYAHHPTLFTEQIELHQQNGVYRLKEMIRIGSITLEETLFPFGHPIYESERGRTLMAPAQKNEALMTIHKFLESDDFNKWSLLLHHFKRNDLLENFDDQYLSRPFNLEEILSFWADELNIYEPIHQIIPDQVPLANGKFAILKLNKNHPPLLSGFIQDFFGLSKTPQLGKFAIMSRLELLGPHKRCVQITSDLHNFWHGSYKEVRKELMRDYPKHFWPENPWEAPAVRLKSHLKK